MKTYTQLLALLMLTFKFGFSQTQVTFYTNKGSFEVSMEEGKRPKTTANFLKLVKAKFYDHQLFYRVIKDFVIQGGDGSGNNTPTIKDELTPALSNVKGTIAMANAGANTGSSEFYINLKDNTTLDKSYTAFGTVISNISVVEAIGSVKTSGSNGNPADKPLQDVVIDSIRVTTPTTEIDDIQKPDNVAKVFPNPTNGVIYVSTTEDITSVFVTDMLGLRVQLSDEKTSFDGKDIQLNMNAPSGIYFLHVITPVETEVHRVVKE